MFFKRISFCVALVGVFFSLGLFSHLSAASAASFTYLVNEGASFTISGTKTVRYGGGTQWLTRQVSGRGACTNAFFGHDPLPYQAKECQVSGTSGVSTGSGAPTLTFKAKKKSISYNDKATLIWLATNVTTCTTPWGVFGSSGKHTTSKLTKDKRYTVTCTGSRGSVTDTASVQVKDKSDSEPKPTIAFLASPSSILSGATTTLTWSTSHADTCTTSWSGTGTSGTYTTPALSSTTSYSVTCQGDGGSKTASVTVTVSTPATTITLTGPTTGTASSASSNFTVGADGIISGTVVVTPSDGSDGGSFSPTTVSLTSSSPTATFTYTAASAGTKSITVSNNGSLSNPSTWTFTASAAPVNGACGSSDGQSFSSAPSTNLCSAGTASSVSGSGPFSWSCTGLYSGTTASCSASLSSGATAVTLSGPTSGTVSVASSNFTVGANSTITGTVTVTPSDAGNGGTFTPTTVNISSGSPTATFTYTAASTGTKSITLTNNGGLSNPSSWSFTVATAGTEITTMTLTAPSTETGAAFTVGQAFKVGDVPTGTDVVVTGATAQVTPKNYWPDGSLKFAVVAGTTDLTAATPKTVTLSTGTAGSGTALGTTDLQNTGITASVTAGAFGSASWSDSDWASPFQSWVSGVQMSSWIYRKQVGSDAHLVAWMEVRLYASGVVEVLPWIENGYVLVASPTNKSATYTFTLGGSQRFSSAIDLKHHQRTPLLSGTALSYWLDTDPAVTPRHDVAYLQETELVPTYRAVVDASDSKVTSLPSTYTPLQQGSFTYSSDYMPDTGFQTPIGLLPQHDVLYLVSDGANIYSSVVRNGYSAGRYGIHYRDENTNRPILPLNHVGTGIPASQGIFGSGGSYSGHDVPTPSGGNPPTWDTAHCPSVGYMAYLATGQWYFMEETQFAAGINYLARADLATQRGTAGEGFVQPEPGSIGVRDSAWAWRTLTQALSATADSDTTWRTAWQTVVYNNIDHYYNRYVAQSNNPLGFSKNGTWAYDGTAKTLAPWQYDFQTGAWGYSSYMGLPISSGYQSKLDDFFEWTAQSVIMRLGTTGSGWPYQNATTYTAKVSSVDTPDWDTGVGPWYTAAQAYSATYTPAPSWLGDTGVNELAGEDLPSRPDLAARSFWGNLQPAIAYAVRHGVTGALDGYNRMIGATNWGDLAGGLDAYPGWSVAPASGATPAWLASAAVHEWKQIANTQAPQEVGDFSGMAVREESNIIELFTGLDGGHSGNLTNNRAMALRLDVDTPAWVERRAASDATGWDTTGATSPYFSDGRPAPRHTYFDMFWSPERNRYLIGGRFWGSGANDHFAYDGFNPDTNDWDPAGTEANNPGGIMLSSRDPATGILYNMNGYKYNPTTNAWSSWDLSGSASLNRGSSAFDPSRQIFYHLSSGDNFNGPSSTLVSTKVSLSGVKTEITFNPSAGLTSFNADYPLTMSAALTYDPDLDRFYYYFGDDASGTQKIYVITPNSGTVWDIALLSVTGVTPADSMGPSGPGGVMNKFVYLSRLKACVLLVPNQNVYYIRMQ